MIGCFSIPFVLLVTLMMGFLVGYSTAQALGIHGCGV